MASWGLFPKNRDDYSGGINTAVLNGIPLSDSG